MKLHLHNVKSDFTQKWGSVKVSFKTLHILCVVANDFIAQQNNTDEVVPSHGEECVDCEVDQNHEDEDEERVIPKTSTRTVKRKRLSDKIKYVKKKKAEVAIEIMEVAVDNPVDTTVQQHIVADDHVVEPPANVPPPPEHSNVAKSISDRPFKVGNSSPLVKIETFSLQLSEFFRSVASWYHMATPIILQYLRHQLLNVMQMNSNISKEAMYQNLINIAKTLSSTGSRNMQRLFINLIATGKGYPLFSAIVYTLRRIDSKDRLIADFEMSTSFESLLDYETCLEDSDSGSCDRRVDEDSKLFQG